MELRDMKKLQDKEGMSSDPFVQKKISIQEKIAETKEVKTEMKPARKEAQKRRSRASALLEPSSSGRPSRPLPDDDSISGAVTQRESAGGTNGDELPEIVPVWNEPEPEEAEPSSTASRSRWSIKSRSSRQSSRVVNEQQRPESFRKKRALSHAGAAFC